jgi:ABC-type glutathione transport system ATPase component
MTAADPVLQLRGVGREFHRHGVTRVALQDVSFELRARATIAIVGESGAGKTTLARLIAGLDTPSYGSISVRGAAPRLRAGEPSRVQMVFQDPVDALNPLLSVGRSVGEPLRRMGRDARAQRVAELLQQVGLDPARASQRPAAFSGGQQQRIVIARALAASPEILICDEPTSALDVSVQAQILNLLVQFQDELGLAMVLVTHDLTVVRVLADEVLLLRAGRVVEHCTAQAFFDEPSSEYGRGLLAAARRQVLATRPASLDRHLTAKRR